MITNNTTYFHKKCSTKAFEDIIMHVVDLHKTIINKSFSDLKIFFTETKIHPIVILFSA